VWQRKRVKTGQHMEYNTWAQEIRKELLSLSSIWRNYGETNDEKRKKLLRVTEIREFSRTRKEKSYLVQVAYKMARKEATQFE